MKRLLAIVALAVVLTAGCGDANAPQPAASIEVPYPDNAFVIDRTINAYPWGTFYWVRLAEADGTRDWWLMKGNEVYTAAEIWSYCSPGEGFHGSFYSKCDDF